MSVRKRPNEITTANLVGWYKCDEIWSGAGAGSSDVYDTMGNHGDSYNGTTGGQTPFVYVASAKFESTTSDYVDLLNPAEYQFSKGTIAFWARYYNIGADFRAFMSKAFAWGVGAQNNEIGFYNGSFIGTGQYKNDGAFHHIVARLNSGVTNGSELWIDGVLYLTFTFTKVLDTFPVNLAAYAGTNFPNCWLDDVALFDDFISDQDIIDLSYVAPILLEDLDYGTGSGFGHTNAEYIAQLTSQYQLSAKTIAFLTSQLDKGVDILTVINYIQYITDINHAFGVQLDEIGLKIGQGREVDFQPTDGRSPVLTDDVYRVLLKAKVVQNHWDGQQNSLYLAWEDIFPGGEIHINDSQDMSAVISLSGSIDLIYQDLINNGYIVPRPQGVLYTIGFGTLPFFGFDRNDDFISGFDIGKFQ